MSIVDFITVVSFGLTCFGLGYTFGKNKIVPFYSESLTRSNGCVLHRNAPPNCRDILKSIYSTVIPRFSSSAPTLFLKAISVT